MTHPYGEPSSAGDPAPHSAAGHAPHPAADLRAELERALDAGEVSAARRLTPQIVESADLDAALAELASRAADSPLAVELLIEALDASGVVRRFAGAALLDHSAVEDVSQDALISIASSAASWDGRGKVTTWVHSIVRRRVTDHLRRRRETTALTEDLGPAERMSSMVASRTTVQDALAALPELYRDPVTLRDIDGLTYAEIAQRLDRAEGTVKAQISRGRAMVAAQLSEEF